MSKPIIAAVDLYPDYARALEVEAEQALRRVAATAEEAGAKLLVVGSSARGPIGRLLPTAVTDRLLRALGLLLCGSRGYGPVRTLLIGGTSHALVRKAACAVLVVPPGTAQRQQAVGAAQALERR